MCIPAGVMQQIGNIKFTSLSSYFPLYLILGVTIFSCGCAESRRGAVPVVGQAGLLRGRAAAAAAGAGPPHRATRRGGAVHSRLARHHTATGGVPSTTAGFPCGPACVAVWRQGALCRLFSCAAFVHMQCKPVYLCAP